ncbi:MAG TPA: nucleotide sugar dehydrogenase [Bryobacteraceae bacterium]|nr:nucleotide sugar dehydrogenase [Bryobacteraceae bacterium]
MNISIIGLGKLGSPMQAVMAHKGHTVIGVDLNPATVKAINAGKAPVKEPRLQEMIDGARDRISATHSYEEALMATDVTMIMVPTPSGKDGRFSMDYVMEAAEKIGAVLKKKAKWHLVVLSSTVMPGSTGGTLLPALEELTGKTCGVDFGLCYNPEFIALGNVVNDMLRPDMILIGESDPKSGALLEEFYTGVCESNPRIRRMNFVNAELTKLSVNTFVTTRISYANMLAQVCETLPGADVDVVTAAIGCDTRIGSKYLKGALGYGGPCFPRDNVAFSALARANGAPALLAEATDTLNRQQVPRMSSIILKKLPKGGTVGVLGLSYKPDTGVIEESQGVAIAKHLLESGAKVIAYDPEAMEYAREPLKGNITFASSAAEVTRQADVLAITTPWPEFKKLTPQDFKHSHGKPVVLDCWRVLPREKFEGAVEYLTLGYGAHERAHVPQAMAAEGD